MKRDGVHGINTIAAGWKIFTSSTRSVRPSEDIARGDYPLDKTGKGWNDAPYELRSLYELLEAYAHIFAKLASNLMGLSHQMVATVNTLNAQSEKTPPGAIAVVAEDFKEFIRSKIGDIRGHLISLDLGTSLLALDQVIECLNRPHCTLMDLEVDLRNFRQTTINELSSRMFLYVPKGLSGLYGQDELFGSTVQQRFSKVSHHVKESGNCLALGRATACVFHLMCVLDIGLDSLAHKLRLPYSEKNWQNIIEQIEKAIAQITPQTHGKRRWKQEQEFCSRAALEFKFFRTAWRNHTIHARKTYTEQEASLIFAHVRAFMMHLAIRLRQRPKR